MKPLRVSVAALAAALALGVGGLGTAAVAPVAAQTSTTQPLGDQIRSARQQAADASADEARLLAAIDASASRKRDLDAKVAALDSQVAATQQAVDVAESRLSGYEAQVQVTEGRLSGAVAALAAAKAELARQGIAAYTGQTQAAQYLDVALRSRDMAELVSKREYIKAVAGSQTEAVANTEHLRNEVKDLRDRASAARSAARSQRDVVVTQQSRAESQRNAEASAAADVATEISQGNALKEQALARKAEFEAKADALQAESDAIAASLRQRAAAEATVRQPAPSPSPPAPSPAPALRAPSPASPAPARAPSASPGQAAPATPARGGKLARPIPGAPITSPFGYRVHPIYGTTRLHTGVDFGASEGTAIHAAEAGTVVTAGWMSGYGNVTIIDHGNGLATLYGHQSSIGVSVGQQVSRGQVIGAVGCTGDCTGPHLHFEVRVNGTPVDPMPYLS